MDEQRVREIVREELAKATERREEKRATVTVKIDASNVNAVVEEITKRLQESIKGRTSF